MPPSLHTIQKRTAPWVWWLMMLLMLMPMGQHAVGAVLCIEANGTVTVEKATGYLCGSPVVSTEKREADTVSSTNEPSSHCDSCIDVVLPGEVDEECASFLLVRGPMAQVDLPVVAIITTSVMAPAAATMPVHHLPLGEHTTSSLTPLQSVILLL